MENQSEVAKDYRLESLTAKGQQWGASWGDGPVLYPDCSTSYMNIHVLKLIDLYSKSFFNYTHSL